ncbi:MULTISPECIES: Hsp33 family molecular chaperone HslO [Pseudomonas]|uniref:33 kDa chaperonin n=2 Tax=Pseudomonas TaxID=286 RepID=A0AAX0W2T3_9PSED|nr:MULTISPECIES: Hsp33 family molecular chaperone HslO [Pseudomonas]MBH3356953.1 Hsp33 family molecular chaperone HslO [Pseudomonas guariconensis]MCO7620844.1 Hsp33 family molecular chaperone HslO [Pseudomonas guariconensis]MDM9596350.1 Hsp33 family molecular chaperone HslO [Pseudomonas guariconensis]MDM9609180.1 Hsp33 family molecular chaperone HslO [Pseudomonas guariconensis]MDM9614138.1 Hsp33 family molecular chaperone HslO [Pseudomonas guariconensis]
MSDLPDTDFTQRFIFDDRDIRGEWVALEQSYADVLARHPYPQPVAVLLGELMAATALLVGALKFDGLLVLQARSQGPIPLLMVECSSDRDIRGMARYEADQIPADATLAQLMPDGHLTLTIDPVKGQRYQGTVDLDGANLSECFTNYFVQSQQLNTRFWLDAKGGKARGLLLQQLPVDRQRDEEEREGSWQHVVALAGTLKPEEWSLDNETLLHRLYHEDAVRLFDIEPLRFHCSCSRERSGNALVSLGEEDAKALVEECGGKVEIDCQFCNERYFFDASDVAQLFAGGGTEAPSDTQH